MDSRRTGSLPPYVFTIIDTLKIEARRAGEDVIDLGFGNPDLPSPDIAVDKLAEAARNSRNHRYSSSRGLPNLRTAVAVSPGVGFGPGGEGFVRFALIENEQRIGQAVRSLRGALTRPEG